MSDGMEKAPARSMRIRAVFLFEMAPAWKGPLLWAALASLIILVVPIRYIMVGDIYNNGDLVGKALRLNYVVAIGYSTIVFLTTLFTLCFCLDRTGTHYLRNNDLLILSRAVSRPAFYLAKMASVLIPAVAYGFLALALFWEELYRVAGVNVSSIFTLIFPLSLSMVCLVSLYFLMRNFLGNFMIFFLWMLLLPVIYVANLWRYYAGFLGEGGIFTNVINLMPQFGGIHAWSLGKVSDFFLREETWRALANCGLWSALAIVSGLFVFSKKRL
ncbi:MAG: hypothetical protein M3Y08_02635 [Fibrobacterota bacterium]|nr:hypothetical protein [Fibrobacterota bacterium]